MYSQPYFEGQVLMKHIKFLVKINNVIGYILIATIVLSPIGFIQVLLGQLVLMVIEPENGMRKLTH